MFAQWWQAGWAGLGPVTSGGQLPAHHPGGFQAAAFGFCLSLSFLVKLSEILSAAESGGKSVSHIWARIAKATGRLLGGPHGEARGLPLLGWGSTQGGASSQVFPGCALDSQVTHPQRPGGAPPTPRCSSLSALSHPSLSLDCAQGLPRLGCPPIPCTVGRLPVLASTGFHNASLVLLAAPGRPSLFPSPHPPRGIEQG